jgi:hypothetical protein
MQEAYLDAEWFIGGKVFLIGISRGQSSVKLLHHRTCTRKHLLQVLPPRGSYLYFYGPDIGILEKHFGIQLRQHYRCINLLKVFRQLMPRLQSYKLAYIEKKYGIQRERCEYKKNIFDIYKDWQGPGWKRVLQYNREDVANLQRLKQIIFKKYGVRPSQLDVLK